MAFPKFFLGYKIYCPNSLKKSINTGEKVSMSSISKIGFMNINQKHTCLYINSRYV